MPQRVAAGVITDLHHEVRMLSPIAAMRTAALLAGIDASVRQKALILAEDNMMCSQGPPPQVPPPLTALPTD
jgi:hypothetical protein